MAKNMAVMDGTEAIAHVAHKVNEVIAIYPITPSSPIAEHADAWSAAGKKNLWGSVPVVVEMQSEGGAAAAVHGALQAGSLSTTFTASQGLLLMIPTMYKIAGELTPTCWHVTARSLAAQALSIFGDHQDVMAVRQTGFALLASNSVQEAHDLALVGSAATLKSRVPFIHFCDGFRTSHEVQKFELMGDDVLRAMIDEELVLAVRERAMTPDRPTLRGTSQNPDVYFQGRETVNRYYLACPGIVQEYMDRLAGLTGPQLPPVRLRRRSRRRARDRAHGVGGGDGPRDGRLPDGPGREGGGAEGPAVPALQRRALRRGAAQDGQEPGRARPHQGAGVGRRAALPRRGERGGRDRPGRQGHRGPLRSLQQGVHPGHGQGRVRRAGEAGAQEPLHRRHQRRRHPHQPGVRPGLHHRARDVYRALFYGLGSDGTVGANKNSIKIIGDDTDNYVQGYFVYDSKKAGVLTVSHLRFGPQPIRSAYLVNKADFIACHVWAFVERYKTLAAAVPGRHLPAQRPLPGRGGLGPAPVRDPETGSSSWGSRSTPSTPTRWPKRPAWAGASTPSCRPASSTSRSIIPPEEAIAAIKKAIEKTYGKRGEKVVQMNYNAVDQAIANLHEIAVPGAGDQHRSTSPSWCRPRPRSSCGT